MRRHARTKPSRSSARMTPRLAEKMSGFRTQGYGASRGGALGIPVEREETEVRHGDAGRAERGAHGVLVGRAARGLRRVVRQPEPLGGERRDDGGGVARGHHPADRARAREVGDLRRGALGPAVVERDVVLALEEQLLDLVAEVAPDDERHAEPARRGAKVVEPVARGRDEEEELALALGHRAVLCAGGARSATGDRSGPGPARSRPGARGRGRVKSLPLSPARGGEGRERGWSSRRSPRASHFPSRALTAPSAASRSSRHTASTSLRSVGVAPTETRMSCRPFTTLGVT